MIIKLHGIMLGNKFPSLNLNSIVLGFYRVYHMPEASYLTRGATGTKVTRMAPPSSVYALEVKQEGTRQRMFVSPVQPALLPGSPRTYGFHVLIIGLPQGRDKEESPTG